MSIENIRAFINNSNITIVNIMTEIGIGMLRLLGNECIFSHGLYYNVLFSNFHLPNCILMLPVICLKILG